MPSLSLNWKLSVDRDLCFCIMDGSCQWMLFPPKLLWTSVKNSTNGGNCMCNPSNELHWVVSWNHLEQKWSIWGGEYWRSPGITIENPARTLPLTIWVFTNCTTLFVPTNHNSCIIQMAEVVVGSTCLHD